MKENIDIEKLFDDPLDNIFGDCPMVDLMGQSLTEPRPYGITLTIGGVIRLLGRLGYQVNQDNPMEVMDGDTSRAAMEVYKEVAERLAIEKFITEYNNLCT